MLKMGLSMKRCIACNALFLSSLGSCSRCESKPAVIDGFYAYVLSLAQEGGGFKPHCFADLAQLEEGNFWFKARNNLIVWMLKKYCPNFTAYFAIDTIHSLYYASRDKINLSELC